MQTHADKSEKRKNKSIEYSDSNKQRNHVQPSQFIDNRPKAIYQRKLQEMAMNYASQQAEPIQKMENGGGDDNAPAVVIPAAPNSTSGNPADDGYRQTWVINGLNYRVSSGHGYRVNHHKPGQPPSEDITQLGERNDIERAILEDLVAAAPAVDESGTRPIQFSGRTVEYRFKRYNANNVGIGTYYIPD